jgi:hypothetical protein
MQSLWFQKTLCVSASYHALYRQADFQKTFLHHRQLLLQWLLEQVNLSKSSASLVFVAMAVALIASDVRKQNALIGFDLIANEKSRALVETTQAQQPSLKAS